MEHAHAFADIVELRIDGMNDPDLRLLLKEKLGQVLVTNRRREEGGAFSGSEAERVALLEDAVSLGADFIDIEASTDPALIVALKVKIGAVSAIHPPRPNPFPQGGGTKYGTKLILSWHDFGGTPSEQILKKKFRDMRAIGADIIKIVTYARKEEDNLRILSLVPYARRQGQEIIAFCMGAAGRSSRIMTAALGSFLTFAALERGVESAPGQMTVDEMKKIWEILDT